MRPLSASDVVSAWERGRGQPPLGQALEYLAAASPDLPRADWASLPFGQVCRALFRLRSIMFGPAMPGVVNCPQCKERLEFSFSCEAVETADADVRPIRIEAGDRAIELRLPTAADLLACRSAADLFARCTSEPIEPHAAWVEAASARVAEADPLIETLLDLVCPACAHRWQAVLDIVGYLTREMAHQARHLLGEVHRLASAYGWGEQEILALSPVRRRAYVEMAGA